MGHRPKVYLIFHFGLPKRSKKVKKFKNFEARDSKKPV